MKIGVTGGLGLLGSAVVACLTERGHTPVVIDRVVAETPEHAPAAAGVRHIQADVCAPDQLDHAFRGLDAVIHTASLIDLHLGQPSTLFDVNVTGARNVVDACRRAGIPRLVHMSSAEVISGQEPCRGVDEDQAAFPDQQLTYYGETKLAGETAVLEAADDRLGTCAMRGYGLYGVGDNTVVPIFLRTLPGRTVIPIGDLTARTDMVFAPNMAFSLVLAAEQLEPGSSWSGTPFHITDHETVNVQRFLADLVVPLGYRSTNRVRLPKPVAWSIALAYERRYRLTGMERFARPVLTTHKLRLSTVDYWLDSSRARAVLGYEPPFSRADAITRTQEWLLATAGGINTGDR